MTTSEWVGLVSLVFFAGVLVWALIQGHKSPPAR
jgi:hypothetical protein